MIRPTPRLAGLIALLAAAVALLGHLSLPGRAALAALAFLVPVVLDATFLVAARRATVSRAPMLIGSLRRELELALTLTGVRSARVAPCWPRALGGPLAPAWVRLREPRTVLRWRATPARRGVFDPGPVWVFHDSALGLWTRREVHAVPCRVHVLPDLHGPADEPLELAGLLERAAPGAFGGAGDLEGLRAFQPGDDPRTVDWKATARKGALIVRDLRPDRRRSIIVAIDAGRLMRADHAGESKLDAAVRATARLAWAAERSGDAVGVVVYADEVVAELPPIHTTGQAARVVRGLATVTPRGTASDLGRAVPRLLTARRSLLITITDVLDPASGRALVGPLRQLGRVHVPVLVLLRDPSLDAALAAPVRTPLDAYRRAAAELIARERAAAQRLAQAAGVPVLDLSMRSLARAVVGTYAGRRDEASPG